MPCYQINIFKMDFKFASHGILIETLKAMGLKFSVNGEEITINTANGPIKLSGGQATLSDAAKGTLNNIRKGYMEQTLKFLAKKYKFNIVNNGTNKGVLRRYT